MTVLHPRHKKLIIARFASLLDIFNLVIMVKTKILIRKKTYSIFGTARLLIAAASTWFMHKIVGSVNSSSVFSLGAGDALSIESPLKRRSAVNVAGNGVSN